MRKIFIVIGVLFLVLFIWARKCDIENNKKLEIEASKPKKEIFCMTCRKNLTNDYNRMEPLNNGNFYCTPCYKSTMRDVREEIRAEGYD